MAPGLGQKGFEAAADSLAGGAHLSGLMQDCEQVGGLHHCNTSVAGCVQLVVSPVDSCRASWIK